jgi:hypothetical protein
MERSQSNDKAGMMFVPSDCFQVIKLDAALTSLTVKSDILSCPAPTVSSKALDLIRRLKPNFAVHAFQA